MGRRAIGIAFIFSKRFLRWITGRIAATGVVGELAVDAVGRADIVGFRNVPRDGHTGQTSRSHGDLVRLRRSFRSPDRRQPRHERRIVFVSAATQTNQRRKNFSKNKTKQEELVSRVGTRHVDFPGGNGPEESVRGATPPQTLDQRSGRLAPS